MMSARRIPVNASQLEMALIGVAPDCAVRKAVPRGHLGDAGGERARDAVAGRLIDVDGEPARVHIAPAAAAVSTPAADIVDAVAGRDQVRHEGGEIGGRPGGDGDRFSGGGPDSDHTSNGPITMLATASAANVTAKRPRGLARRRSRPALQHRSAGGRHIRPAVLMEIRVARGLRRGLDGERKSKRGRARDQGSLDHV